MNSVPLKAHVVALFAEVFISQTEGQILQGGKEKEKDKSRKWSFSCCSGQVIWSSLTFMYLNYHVLFSPIPRIPAQGVLIFLFLPCPFFFFFLFSVTANTRE